MVLGHGEDERRGDWGRSIVVGVNIVEFEIWKHVAVVGGSFFGHSVGKKTR